MGMLISEMKKGIKCLVQGPSDINNEKSEYINSLGIIMEQPSILAKTVLVSLVHGPNKNNELVKVPIADVYWINQNINI